MLNEAKGNMYSWITHTWNTIKGECPHGCTYCYMKRFGQQKPVHFDKKEFNTDLGSGNFIFVGSSCDMFAQDIDKDWIGNTLAHCSKFHNHYLFQTKNPAGILECLKYEILPERTVVCTTIETNRWYPEFMKDSPKPLQRAKGMLELSFHLSTYVTLEPIMDFDLESLVELIWMCKPSQVNIGADSGNNNLPEPSADKIYLLIEQLERFTKIDRKINLKRLLK
jgi:DNA repair photolyase